jgi:hypothetical protein
MKYVVFLSNINYAESFSDKDLGIVGKYRRKPSGTKFKPFLGSARFETLLRKTLQIVRFFPLSNNHYDKKLHWEKLNKLCSFLSKVPNPIYLKNAAF